MVVRFALYSMKWLVIPKELAIEADTPDHLATEML
jgi:hypothetical protein